MLATHGFALAHLRAVTQPRRAVLWSLSPVPLGPIASCSPRWVLEGYATYVEGRVTGSGRPNHAWRAAILRQFALEGRLPSYGQLSATGGWQTGSFAYLAGSAYFDWLSRREGDSSVTALWKRMTAKTDRSFDEAFIGVYGASPGELYGRFVAELTADALAFDRALARDALVDGTLVQRWSANTEIPPSSLDGRYVAIPSAASTLRASSSSGDRRRPAPPPRRRDRSAAETRGSDRSFYRRPSDIVISLMANDGAPYESPRWMPTTAICWSRGACQKDGFAARRPVSMERRGR